MKACLVSQRLAPSLSTPMPVSITSGLLVRQHVRVNRFVLTFSWTAVLLAGGEVWEAVGIALAAAVVEGLTPHAGHVEEVAAKEGAAGSLLFGKPADLGNLWGQNGKM